MKRTVSLRGRPPLHGCAWPQVLLKAFITNLKSPSPTTRRTAAGCVVSVCQHSRRTQYFYSWLLSVLLGEAGPGGARGGGGGGVSPASARDRPLRSGRPRPSLGLWADPGALLTGKWELGRGGCEPAGVGVRGGKGCSSAEAWAPKASRPAGQATGPCATPPPSCPALVRPDFPARVVALSAGSPCGSLPGVAAHGLSRTHTCN